MQSRDTQEKPVGAALQMSSTGKELKSDANRSAWHIRYAKQAASASQKYFSLCSDAMRPRAVLLLKVVLAVVFFWFGALKLADISPVKAFLMSSFPVMAQSPFLEILGIAEIAMAAGLVMTRLAKLSAGIMTLHLLGTLSVAFVAPHLLFAPAFPCLTMEGEFVTKNLVLIAAGLVVVFCDDLRSPALLPERLRARQ